MRFNRALETMQGVPKGHPRGSRTQGTAVHCLQMGRFFWLRPGSRKLGAKSPTEELTRQAETSSARDRFLPPCSTSPILSVALVYRDQVHFIRSTVACSTKLSLNGARVPLLVNDARTNFGSKWQPKLPWP